MEEVSYSWKEDDKFEFNGKEFEFVHNTLSTIFNTNLPESQMYVMLHKLLEITSGILKKNIDSGVVISTPIEK